jgi:hypothetical protein
MQTVSQRIHHFPLSFECMLLGMARSRCCIPQLLEVEGIVVVEVKVIVVVQVDLLKLEGSGRIFHLESRFAR